MPVLVFGKVRDLIARNRPVASGRFGHIRDRQRMRYIETSCPSAGARARN
jgi:hypothetical protein